MKTKPKFKDYLFKPFCLIAGVKALILSIILMTVLALLGYLSNTNFDGALDVHFGYLSTITPFKIHIWYQISTFISLTLMFYLVSIVMSKTPVRFIDISGTLSLARFPLIVMALLGFIPSVHIRIETIDAFNIAEMSKFAQDNILSLFIMAVISILSIAWVIVLMYNAFSVSSNLKGQKGGFSFVVGLILAEIASKVLNYYIIPLL